MKTLKLLSMLVFAVFLVSAVSAITVYVVSAITVYAEWEDKSNAITITDGDSVVFNADFISVSPMTINIRLYETDGSLIHVFENDLIINEDCVVDGTTYPGAACYFPSITIDQSIYNTPGQYELVLNGNDATNLPQEEVLYLTVNDIPDTNAPVITLLGQNPVQVTQGSVYTDAGATALDDVDGDITADIVVVGDVIDTNIVGVYTITYDVSDTAGNPAVRVIRTVSVIPPSALDTTAPVITLLGQNPVQVTQGSVYTDAGATALDDVDGDITANIVVVGDVIDTNTVGVYIITYNVQDTALNDAIEVTRTVNVFDPSELIPPTITVITPEEGDEYTEELYLNQFKPSKIIYLEDEQPEEEMTWWQKFVEWLKRIFGFN